MSVPVRVLLLTTVPSLIVVCLIVMLLWCIWCKNDEIRARPTQQEIEGGAAAAALQVPDRA